MLVHIPLVSNFLILITIGKDACTGDGGSPLVCETGKGGTWQVVGLVAWGIGCADYGIPGAYVNVPNYVDWINEEIYRY